MLPALHTKTVLTRATPWPEVVDAYLAAAVDSAHSRRAYRRHLFDALSVIGHESLAQLTGSDLAAYRASVTSSPLSPASQAQALTALRSFLSWAGTMGAHHLPGEVIRLALKTPRASVRKPYTVLSDREIARIIDAADNSRDRALLAVMLGGGLRVAEAVALDVTDIRADADDGSVVYVRQGKGRKDRLVPIHPDTEALIRAYLSDTNRRLGDAGPLFLSHDRAASKRGVGRLTARAVGYVVTRCAGAAGIDAKKVSPHALRHTFAIRALRSGGNVVAVSKLLGHASIATTQRYVDHLALRELRAAVPALPIS